MIHLISDNEEVVQDAQVTIEDTIFVTTQEVKVEYPWLTEDPLIEATSSFTPTTWMNDVKVLFVHTGHAHQHQQICLLPLTSIARRHYNSYNIDRHLIKVHALHCTASWE